MRSVTSLINILGILVLMLVGCANEVKGDESIAEHYIEQNDYQVTSRKGEIDQYILDKSKLYGSPESTPYLQSWGVQAVDPEKYFGKVISVYLFTVKNHPLEEKYKRETDVSVMICEGKVIGGTSFPVQEKELLMGAPYSLDGKTLEEVTRMTYQEWLENWKIKYSN